MRGIAATIRLRPVAAAAVAAAALGVSAALVLVGGSFEPSRQAPVAEQSPEHEAAGFFGVSPQTHLAEEDFQRMREGGVRILRWGLTWDEVQPTAGECDPEGRTGTCSWETFDRIVGGAAAYGIRVLPTVGGRPPFAREPGSGKYVRQHPPTEGPALQAWREFVRAAAARYGRGGAFWKEFAAFGEARPIEEWQVWNEPNAAAYWPPEPDAEEYATLVRETATAIREADPEAEIVLGGMFGTTTVRSDDYLRELYAVDGISEYFDSIAIHPYSPRVHGVKVQARWVREAAIEAGDHEVGLWVTEVGAASLGGEHPLQIGEEEQAQLLDRAFALLVRRREAWNVEGVTWFTWKDDDDGHVCQFCANAGLFDARSRAKPAWDVYKARAGEVG